MTELSLFRRAAQDAHSRSDAEGESRACRHGEVGWCAFCIECEGVL